MANHTLILSTTKTAIPANLKIDFVTNLINRGLALTEYFGIEIDNQSDYIEPDMKNVSTEITYIEIYFETKEPIDYDALSEVEVDQLILDLFTHSETKDIHSDGKDIKLYLHPQ